MGTKKGEDGTFKETRSLQTYYWLLAAQNIFMLNLGKIPVVTSIFFKWVETTN